MAQVQIRDKQDRPIVLMNVRLALGDGDSDSAYDDRFTDLAGNTAWPNPLSSNNGYTLHVNKANVNTKYKDATVKINNFDNDIKIVLDEVVIPVQRIHMEPDRFVTEDGKTFKWIFATNFMLHQLVAEGIDILPFLYNNCNGYRVFGSMHWIPSQIGMKDFDPDNYPNWATSLETLCDILASKGEYLQYNVLCDRQFLPGDVNKMRNMVGTVNEISKVKKNLIGALGNENPKNGFNANDFQRPTGGAVWSTGSGLGGGPAPLSNGKAWDYQCQHLRRDEKMFIDIPPIEAPTYNLNHVLLFDEPIGFADFELPNRRTMRLDWAFQLGTVARGWYGMVAHLQNGVHSQALGVRENECLQEFVRGMTE